MADKKVLGAVLCGGRSRRMGSDKAFVLLQGVPLLDHVIGRFAPQVDKVVVNTRHINDDPRMLSYTTCPDLIDEFKGPLAGVHAVLDSNIMDDYDYLAIVPCDAPLLPNDLVEQLLTVALKNNVPHVAVKLDGFLQPTFSIWHRSLISLVKELVSEGEGSLKSITQRCESSTLDWPAENSDCFCNINNENDLNSLN